MGEREAFGPNLRWHRVQRGISLEQIAASTKVPLDLWVALERNDFSRWPTGLYARAYVRAYALAVGTDPAETVEAFRWRNVRPQCLDALRAGFADESARVL